MNAVILNQGVGQWAFEEHASNMADVLWLEVSSEPAECDYVLGWDGQQPPAGELFIPWSGIQAAADKRIQARLYQEHSVPCPRSLLFTDEKELCHFLAGESHVEWVLKYPVACGASGHRLIKADSPIPADWPEPFLLQQFIRLENPEVYRAYCVEGEFFGWNARRFPAGTKPSPWVAHAQGARYVHFGKVPAKAEAAARAALQAVGLLESFGVVDLLQSPEGEWLVLEVGTDGVVNHVDRDFDSEELHEELNRRLAEAFWRRSEKKPWGEGNWRLRNSPMPAI